MAKKYYVRCLPRIVSEPCNAWRTEPTRTNQHFSASASSISLNGLIAVVLPIHEYNYLLAILKFIKLRYKTLRKW